MSLYNRIMRKSSLLNIVSTDNIPHERKVNHFCNPDLVPFYDEIKSLFALKKEMNSKKKELDKISNKYKYILDKLSAEKHSTSKDIKELSGIISSKRELLTSKIKHAHKCVPFDSETIFKTGQGSVVISNNINWEIDDVSKMDRDIVDRINKDGISKELANEIESKVSAGVHNINGIKVFGDTSVKFRANYSESDKEMEALGW